MQPDCHRHALRRRRPAPRERAPSPGGKEMSCSYDTAMSFKYSDIDCKYKELSSNWTRNIYLSSNPGGALDVLAVHRGLRDGAAVHVFQTTRTNTHTQ